MTKARTPKAPTTRSPSELLADRIDAATAPLIDPAIAARLTEARKRVSAALRQETAAAARFVHSGGAAELVQDRDAARDEAKSARSAVLRIGADLASQATAALPEVAAIAGELADLAAALAQRMQSVERQLANVGGVHDTTPWDAWPSAHASARGLAVLAHRLGRAKI